MILQYPVNLVRDDNGRVELFFDGLPGRTWGQDEADALTRAADALIIILAGYVDAGECIPPPPVTRGRPLVSLPPLEAAKVALHNAMLAAGATDADMACRLKIPKSAAQRLRNPVFPGELVEVEAAFATLLADTSQSDVPA